SAVDPKLRRHLDRDFNCNGAGVRKEHVAQVTWHKRGETPRKAKRLFVNESAKHDVRHGRQLVLDCLSYVGMVVTVARSPPAGDAVDQLTPIGQNDPRTQGARNRQGRRNRLHLCIGKPDMVQACAIPMRRIAVFAGLARHLTFPRSVRAKHLACQLARSPCNPSTPSPTTNSTSSSAGTFIGRSTRHCARMASGLSAAAANCCRFLATTISISPSTRR